MRTLAVAVAAAFAFPAYAQDKPPAAPPAWKQGMPEKYKD